jgi:hypothetical protein
MSTQTFEPLVSFRHVSQIDQAILEILEINSTLPGCEYTFQTDDFAGAKISLRFILHIGNTNHRSITIG